ncbi:MAG: hypothetical protein NUW23_03310 [Firmicutes bacterium]|jgi:hypothetical protein|nr:hypothetical protein [Bacillota bacterium]
MTWLRFSAGPVEPDKVRLVRIKNTLELSRMLVSEALLPEVAGFPGCTMVGEPEPLQFDDAGNLSRWDLKA